MPVLITNHVLSGAVTGAVAGRPGPAFLAGVASHFVLDALPHWGKVGEEQFLRVAVADGLTGLAAMAVLAAVAPRGRRAAVLAGMAGAALPDLDKPSGLWFGFSPWPAPVDRFHQWIQDEAPDRLSLETMTATMLAVSAFALVRAGARRRRRRAPALRRARPGAALLAGA
jgi:hypothetical protein